MTVTYSAEVATSRGFGCFWKLLFRWRGSIYKLLWPDLILYIGLYYSLTLIYKCCLMKTRNVIPQAAMSLGIHISSYHSGSNLGAQMCDFEKVALYCASFADLIPVSFVLGFYVSLVGVSLLGMLQWHSMARFIGLLYKCLSTRSGILLPNEKQCMEDLKTPHSKYWMPLVWASSIATRARKEGRIRDDFALKTIVDAIATYRSNCGGLYNFDWISIPLVYTQVVTLAVYTFFLATLMGRQHLDPNQGYKDHKVDLYIPIFNFLQFFFYMGWLKVAETLVNPFGEDDDDFEINWVIDRNLQVSYLVVDEMHHEHPELIRDQYWDEIMPPELPYTAASEQFRTEPPQGSAAQLIVTPHEAELVHLESEENQNSPDGGKNSSGNFIQVKSFLKDNPLSRNLSISTRSSISGLGSQAPHRQSILSHLHRLFSRERVGGSSISLQSGGRAKKRRGNKKQISKDPESPTSSVSSASSIVHAPSNRPPRDFPEDIFHLSDLSLVEPHLSTETLTPNVVSSSLQLPDMFNRIRLARHSSRQRRNPPHVVRPYLPPQPQPVVTSPIGEGEQINNLGKTDMHRSHSSTLRFQNEITSGPTKKENGKIVMQKANITGDETQNSDQEGSTDSDEPTVRVQVVPNVICSGKGTPATGSGSQSGSLGSIALSLSPDEDNVNATVPVSSPPVSSSVPTSSSPLLDLTKEPSPLLDLTKEPSPLLDLTKEPSPPESTHPMLHHTHSTPLTPVEELPPKIHKSSLTTSPAFRRAKPKRTVSLKFPAEELGPHSQRPLRTKPPDVRFPSTSQPVSPSDASSVQVDESLFRPGGQPSKTSDV